jgi:hypothetical protein
MNNTSVLEITWREAAVAYFKVLYVYLPTGTDDKDNQCLTL